MTLDTTAICQQLRGLIEMGPGENTKAAAKVRSLLSSLHGTDELAKSVATSKQSFENWFGQRPQKNQDRARLITNLHNLEMALNRSGIKGTM